MRHTPHINKLKHPRPSSRSFGLLFMVVFAAFGVHGLYWSSEGSVYGWFAASVVVGLFALFIPRLLAPFNEAWFLLGELLGRVASPIVLGVIFFGLLTPVGLITRLFGRDELHLRCRPVNSYWRVRVASPCPSWSDAVSFKNQF